MWWCQEHLRHASDCSCPEVSDLEGGPYSAAADGVQVEEGGVTAQAPHDLDGFEF